ncbi:TPA: hypothetical protein N0F65_011601 [Lagenidium giganteum]|uniref:Mitochondrial PGP phosphatase n=1 Tax=Lagenidium giganteum TaxID=4803 RepID=A0AAV2ZCG9_9STRA|nr:TPA: hypothetical protein N0F65_011601 [Lagenidium giganteum]
MKGLNLRGVTEFCRAIVQRPQLLLPQLSVHDLNDVSFQALKDRGFQGVVFDKDNTLTTPHQKELAPQVAKSINECKHVFGDAIIIFSNSAGSDDDPGFKKAQEVEQSLEIAVLRHSSKKPGGIEQLQAHFGVDPAHLIMIGDRYSTDVLFGNMHGMLTIRTEQLSLKGETLLNITLQKIEKTMIAGLLRAGIRPLRHPLMDDEPQDKAL